jgi:TPP-dependent pyruvate/acetoin dehydrogenase alpha subunit
MDIGAETEATFENPLIPNARLRQMYAAMLRARLLGEVLSGRRRRGRDETLGLEAALVATSVDLASGDVVSDAMTGGVIEFLRGATLERVLRPKTAARKRGLKADCSAAMRLPAGMSIQERIWAALGAAAVLKAERAQDKEDGKELDVRHAGVAVVYTRLGELTPGLWASALTFASVEELPVMFVVLPAAGNAKHGQAGAVARMAMRHGVPGIPVDADDAVAIYRVAQEAIGRGRIGGGAALMECVPFVLPAGNGKRNAETDSIAVLGQYMLGRGVVTKNWMERERKNFAKHVAG